MPLRRVHAFFQSEIAGGIVLVSCALLAMLAANSALSEHYFGFLATPVAVRVGELFLDKTLLLLINDFLMAIFFLLVGLEIKREVLDGELSDPKQIVLPVVAAIGGMLVPALIYTAFNSGHAEAMHGWAIPTATDIAFALGVLALLGKRVPSSLKLFLLTLAILDDLGAVLIIAMFYSDAISLRSMIAAGLLVLTLMVMNGAGLRKNGPFMLVGVLLWVAVLKSGVHATLAGVVLGFCIPLRGGASKEDAPLHSLEHALHPYVAFAILPLFAFANAGLSLSGMSLSDALSPVPLGVALGLLLGKPLGVFCFTYLVVRFGGVARPAGANWTQLLGVSLLCGIGFTMSLFIASLAFSDSNGGERLGILAGSLLSALLGYALLRIASKPKH